MATEIVPVKIYVRSFVLLMGLLVLTVGANFVNLGPFNTAAAMAISVAKACV